MNEDFDDRLIGGSGTTRRKFIQGSLAAGLVLSTSSGLWNKAFAAGPRKGGHMRVGMNDANASDSLDPGSFIGSMMVCTSRAFRDSLIEIGQDSQLKPALAESWEASPDAKTWRFKLRKGVEFSNGKTLSVEDVVSSINIHRGAKSTSGAKGVFEGISDVRADGGDVVVVELAQPDVSFPYVMTDYHMQVVPSRDGKADVLSPVGTGCYILKEFKPGVRAVLERNPNAWQSASCGFVDSVEILVLLDDAARQNALVAGKVDVINSPALKTAALLSKAPGIRLLESKSNKFYAHPMFCDVGPFSDNNFRMALKHALPRKEFVDKVLSGFGRIANDSPIGPMMEFYDDSIPLNDFDLDRAKYYLQQSGVGSGVKIDMHTADTAYTGAVDGAVLFKDAFSKIGVDLNIIREPNDGYWTNVWLKKPFCATYWSSRPVENMILSIAFTSTARWNDAHLNLPRVDQLVATARSEFDSAKRQQIYSEIQNLLSKQGGHLVPAFGADLAAVRSTVGVGEQLGTGYEMDGGYFIKRWWMQS